MTNKSKTNILIVASLLGMCMITDLFGTQSPPALAKDKKTFTPETPIEVSLSSDVKYIVPGKSFKLFVDFDLQPDWHIYYKDPGQTGMPTQIEWTLPKGFTATAISWPPPQTYKESGIVTYGYSKKVRLATTVTPAKQLVPGESVRINARASWLACKHSCVPGNSSLNITFKVQAK